MRHASAAPTRRHVLLGLASFAAAAVAPRLGHAHTFQVQTVKCPVDGTSFDVRVTGSMTTFGALRDFQKRGAIGTYYEDLVHACPTCHFAGYLDDFGKPVSAATKQWVLGELKKTWGGKKLTEAEECEVAALRLTFEKVKGEPIAYVWLVGSYLLRGAGPALEGKRKDYQRAAAKGFSAALAAGEAKEDARAAMRYLVGELARRTGDFPAAVVHFDAARADPKAPPWLATMCDEQRAMAVKGDANNDI